MSASISSALELSVAAFLIALTGAMAPGPYLTVTITRTIQRGRLSALLMLVGHALLEAVLLVGFAFGLQGFLAQPTVMNVLSIAGGAFLLWMGGSLMIGVLRGTVAADLEAAEVESRMGPVVHGAAVSLANPYWLLWWVTIGAALAAKGLSFGPTGVAAFYIGHELADLAWYAAVILAVSSGKRLLSPRVYRAIMGVLAAFLLYLGARFLISGLSGVT